MHISISLKGCVVLAQDKFRSYSVLPLGYVTNIQWPVTAVTSCWSPWQSLWPCDPGWDSQVHRLPAACPGAPGCAGWGWSQRWSALSSSDSPQMSPSARGPRGSWQPWTPARPSSQCPARSPREKNHWEQCDVSVLTCGLWIRGLDAC